MLRDDLIASTIKKISQLPERRIEEVSDFADFLLKKIDDQLLEKGMESISTKSLDFLKTEDDIYTVSDLKEVYKSEKR